MLPQPHHVRHAALEDRSSHVRLLIAAAFVALTAVLIAAVLRC
jgi:hypothetical protein